MISEPQEPIDDTLFQSDLTHFTAFSVSGADATNFLQGQLTQDMTLATENHAVLSAYCSPKGRVLASFLIWKEVQADNEEIFRFLVRNDIAEPMIKRLRMFVMRSKVVFTPETLSVKGIYPLQSKHWVNVSHWTCSKCRHGRSPQKTDAPGLPCQMSQAINVSFAFMMRKHVTRSASAHY